MAGQDDVVEALLSARGRALTGYAYLLCGHVQDAEDLVQDALVKTFARRRAGLRLESAEGYVRTTILTLYLDGWRRRGRWSVRRHLVAQDDVVASPEEGATARADVVAAMRHLSPRQRACVVLRFYEDLTVAEIADRLGVSDGAVKRYLSTGVHRMEALLGPVHAPGTEANDTEIVQEA